MHCNNLFDFSRILPANHQAACWSILECFETLNPKNYTKSSQKIFTEVGDDKKAVNGENLKDLSRVDWEYLSKVKIPQHYECNEHIVRILDNFKNTNFAINVDIKIYEFLMNFMSSVKILEIIIKRNGQYSIFQLHCFFSLKLHTKARRSCST